MIQINRVLFVGFFFVLIQGICPAQTFDKLRRDPLRSFVAQPQEEGGKVYILPIDINADGLNDVLISHAQPGESSGDEEESDWAVYLKVQGGYKQVAHTIYLNWNYIALDNRGTNGAKVITFYEDIESGDGKEEVTSGTGHLYSFDTQFIFPHIGELINSGSESFKTLFAKNYEPKIKTLSQSEVNRFYSIRVFPKGKRQDYNNDIIMYEDLKTLPRTDPNSDTTGTMLTYGIILGNYTTSETLQLQAKAEKSSQTQRPNGPKGDAVGKDRKQPDTQASPTPKTSEKATQKEKTPSVSSQNI